MQSSTFGPYLVAISKILISALDPGMYSCLAAAVRVTQPAAPALTPEAAACGAHACLEQGSTESWSVGRVCLSAQRLGPEESQFIYDAACANTMEIATHRHGCCVLQRCIDFATPMQKRRIVEEIGHNAYLLSQVASPHLCVRLAPSLATRTFLLQCAVAVAVCCCCAALMRRECTLIHAGMPWVLPVRACDWRMPFDIAAWHAGSVR
jgi:Pumilio-family RNA binding repeat